MERQSQGRLRGIAWATAGCIAIALVAGAQSGEEPIALPPVDGAPIDVEHALLARVVDAVAPTGTGATTPHALKTAISTALEVPWIRRPRSHGARGELSILGFVAPASTVQFVIADEAAEPGPSLSPVVLLAQPAPLEPPTQEAPRVSLEQPIPLPESPLEYEPPLEPPTEEAALVGAEQPPPPPEPPLDDDLPSELPPLPTPPVEQGFPPFVVPDEPVDDAAAPADVPVMVEPPCPCEAAGGSDPGGCSACSPLAGCHEDPAASFPSTVHDDILELFAVDIARRCLLALHPYAADEPILTLDVVVRPSGHIVHTYARLQWHRRHWWNLRGPAKVYETEVSASIFYHPDRRRVFDVSYVDNAYFPFRNVDMTSQVTASYNEDFALRDGTGLPPKFLSDRVDVLEPYPEARIFNFGPVREPDPRAKQLRVVRRDSNVTANQ